LRWRGSSGQLAPRQQLLCSWRLAPALRAASPPSCRRTRRELPIGDRRRVHACSPSCSQYLQQLPCLGMALAGSTVLPRAIYRRRLWCTLPVPGCCRDAPLLTAHGCLVHARLFAAGCLLFVPHRRFISGGMIQQEGWFSALCRRAYSRYMEPSAVHLSRRHFRGTGTSANMPAKRGDWEHLSAGRTRGGRTTRGYRGGPNFTPCPLAHLPISLLFTGELGGLDLG